MLRIWFDSFWGTFDKYDNFFTWILSSTNDVFVTPENPDIVFTDNRYYQKSSALAIYFSGEPFFNINNCDYALTSFHVNDSRFITLPLYTLYAYDLFKHKIIKNFDSIKLKDYTLDKLNEKQKFCAYVAQGGGGPKSPRSHYVELINQYRNVDCAGKHLNNHSLISGEPGTIEGSIHKINFLRKYKFALAIENNESYEDYVGYTTEKIYETMVAGCIPIYWGNPLIEEHFNKESMIHVRDYNDDELLRLIASIDQNQDLFMDYFLTPYLSDKNQYLNKDYWIEIFSSFV